MSGRALWLAFVAVVGSFFLSSFIVLRSSTAIATLSESIVENSAPSIEHLASIRRMVLEVELALSHLVEQPVGHPEHARALDAALVEARRSMHDYLSLPAYPDEQRPRIELQESWHAFELAVRETRELASTNTHGAALASLTNEVEPSRRRLLDHTTTIIQANAADGRAMAQKIHDTRRRTVQLAAVLDVACGVFAIAVGWLLHREAVLRRALATTHFAAIEARAAELEQFAGRVAHDIRNPLAAARVAAELAEKRTSDEFVRELHRRIMRSLGRADAITTDLLGFARSGAKPDPGARAAPRSIVHEVTTDLAHDAERVGIELCADPVPPVAVACSRGVYLSLLGNLVRNAIKYMRDAPTRRITVRVVEDDGFVRTEVVDTGPGIAEDLLPSLFQPYFRGPSGGAEGLGLGLATVKRLAEGHGGRAGVRSERGKGSTFWFELPRAGVDEVEEVRGSAPSHPAFQPRNSA
ncbi:MAG: sensor histidine kinase [Polyangiales bacterium]